MPEGTAIDLPHPFSQALDTALESVFVCFIVRNLMEKFQVQVKLAKPRSPWTGGRLERVIQSLNQMLIAKLDEFPDYSVELALKIVYSTIIRKYTIFWFSAVKHFNHQC